MSDDSLVIMSATLRVLADAVLAQGTDAAGLRQAVNSALNTDRDDSTIAPFVPGYASGSRRNTWRGLDAVCSVLGRLDLRGKPFDPGQKIGAVSTLAAQATVDMAELCLIGIDLLEGLNQYPVIVHCDDVLLFGVWLGPYRSANALTTDPIQLRELLGANDLVLVDPALLTNSSTPETRKLTMAAREHIELRAPARFDAMLDITALRQSNRSRSTPHAMNTLSEVTLGIGGTGSDLTDNADNEPTDDLHLPPFDPPMSDSAALSSLAVALGMPRAAPDPQVIDKLESVSLPQAATNRAQLYCVLPADGDQRLAVKAANGQESYCLIASPGTGGIQTAVNICSQLVARRTRVLVVAQSKHHLSRFHRHLISSGLARSCDATYADLSDSAGASHQPTPDQSTDIDSVRSALIQIQRDRLNYAKSLGPDHPGGWSLHLALGICALSPETFEALAHWRDIAAEDLPDPETLNEWTGQLRQASRHLRPAAHGHLDIIGHVQWSQPWEARLVDAARKLSENAQKQEKHSLDLTTHLDIEQSPATQSEFVALKTVAENLAQCTAADIALACHSDLSEIHAELNTALALTKEYDQCQHNLDAQYNANATETLDIDLLIEMHSALQQASWPRSMMTTSKIRRLLSKAARGRVESADDVLHLYRMREISRELGTLETLPRFFPKYWFELTSDFLSMSERLESAEQLVAAANSLHKTDQSDTAPPWLLNLNATVTEFTGALKETKQVCGRYMTHADELRESLKTFVELAAPAERVSGEQGQSWLTFMRQLADNVVDHRWEIKDWCQWRGTTDQSGIDGLPEILKTIDQEQVPDGQLADVLRYACARAWLEKYLYTNDPDLIDEADGHVGQPARHRELSDAYRLMVAHEVNELGDAQHPACVLASANAAQHNTQLTSQRFDTTIFLDADRVNTTDAIRVLGLGRRGIFIGDPFQASTNLGTSRYQTLDGSIASADVLHQAIALGLSAITLRQDYSATNPLLINQTNRIAPSVAVRPLAPANDLDQPIQVTSVPGAIWGDADKRDNLTEAKQVVAELAAELRSMLQVPTRHRPSISVVAMTDEQTELICSVLHQYREQHPDINQILQPDQGVTLSIRSATAPNALSDIVFLSTTVANLSQRPGKPILDVLYGKSGMRSLYRTLCSARHRLHVITSLTADELSAFKFGSNALGHLYRWIEAGNETSAGLPTVLQMPDSLTQTVREALNQRGWQAAIPLDSVGAGIDLIVEHPELPGHSLAGIATDAGFFLQPRHDVIRRDDCQERALAAAGWTVLQAWPLQWYLHKDAAADALHNELIVLREQWRMAESRSATRKPTAHPAEKHFKRLTQADLADCDPDGLMSPDYEPVLAEIVDRIIQQEGPIRKDYLINRVAALHQLSLLSDAAQQRIERLLKDYQTTREDQHEFLWPNDLSEQGLTYRAPARHEDKRQLAEISPQELTAIARHFDITPEQPDATRALARAIGIAYPASSLMRNRLTNAIKAN